MNTGAARGLVDQWMDGSTWMATCNEEADDDDDVCSIEQKTTGELTVTAIANSGAAATGNACRDRPACSGHGVHSDLLALLA